MRRILLVFLCLSGVVALADRDKSNDPQEFHLGAQWNRGLTGQRSMSPEEIGPRGQARYEAAKRAFERIHEPFGQTEVQDDLETAMECENFTQYPTTQHSQFVSDTAIGVIRWNQSKRKGKNLSSGIIHDEGESYTDFDEDEIDDVVQERFNPKRRHGSHFTHQGGGNVGMYFDCTTNDSRFERLCFREIRPFEINGEIAFAIHQKQTMFDNEFPQYDQAGEQLAHNIQDMYCITK